jgi:cysteine desulfurase
MAAERAYLDWNASAPLCDAARTAMVGALVAANPSSVHREGRAARGLVEEARRAVAALVNGKPEHVVFTSGATEAASTLLAPEWRMGRSPLRMGRLYVSEADHPCVLSGGRFPAERVTRIGVDQNGILDIAALKTALAAHDKAEGLALVAVHAANNETGVIQPVEEIGRVVKADGGVLVLDAVQAAGSIPLDISAGYADYLILSSHKIGGPKGAGAIVAAADLMMPAPLVTGGGQEKGHRAGTENLPAIVGFGDLPRLAPRRVHRRGVAAGLHGGHHRGDGFRAIRRGGVVVEVRVRGGHDVAQLAAAIESEFAGAGGASAMRGESLRSSTSCSVTELRKT